MATVTTNTAPTGHGRPTWAEGMDDDEKYAFDTGGYVVLRRLLSRAEVSACNDQGC
jgi:hypothetical protein